MTQSSQTARGSGHFVQELGLDVEPGDDVWTGEASVPPGALAAGGVLPLASVLISYADVLAGSQVRAMTLPQMSVTVDLSLDMVDPVAVSDPVTDLALESRILRSGRRSYVTRTDFLVAGHGPVAVCTGSFSAISRTHNALGDGMAPPAPRHERPLLETALAARVGLEVVAPGQARLARRPDLGNSTDSLMGGLTALLGEVAALSAVGGHGEAGHLAERLHIRYLAPVRVGPAEAAVEMVAGGPERQIVRVAVRDLARPSERAADVTVACIPAPGLRPGSYTQPNVGRTPSQGG